MSPIWTLLWQRHLREKIAYEFHMWSELRQISPTWTFVEGQISLSNICRPIDMDNVPHPTLRNPPLNCNTDSPCYSTHRNKKISVIIVEQPFSLKNPRRLKGKQFLSLFVCRWRWASHTDPLFRAIKVLIVRHRRWWLLLTLSIDWFCTVSRAEQFYYLLIVSRTSKFLVAHFL